MKPGEKQSFSQIVSVNYLDDPKDQDYSEWLNGTYTYLGTYQVTVPAGTYEAVVFRLRCEGEIGPAHTQDTDYYVFAPGVGIIAMILQEHVTAFWIILASVLMALNPSPGSLTRDHCLRSASA